MFQTMLSCCKGHCDNIFFFFFAFSLSVLLFPDTHSVSVEISTEITR